MSLLGLGPNMTPKWPKIGRFWVILDPYLGPILRETLNKRGHFDPYLGSFWPIFGVILDPYLGPILRETLNKSTHFGSFWPPWFWPSFWPPNIMILAKMAIGARVQNRPLKMTPQNLSWAQGAQIWPKKGPQKWPLNMTKSGQNRPKTDPKMTQKWPKNGSKSTQNDPKMTQNRSYFDPLFGPLQMGPLRFRLRNHRIWAKSGQKGSKRDPKIGHILTPKWPKMTPKWPKYGHIWVILGQNRPKVVFWPFWPKWVQWLSPGHLGSSAYPQPNLNMAPPAIYDPKWPKRVKMTKMTTFEALLAWDP